VADTTSSSILRCDRLPTGLALPLIAMFSIASWVAVIGVVYLERLTISYLTGI
jgi:hypothetical protein